MITQQNLVLAQQRIPQRGLHISGLLADDIITDPIKENSPVFWQQSGENELNLSVTPNNDGFVLTGKGNFCLIHPCVKCLESATFSLSIDFNRQLVEDAEAGMENPTIMGSFDKDEALSSLCHEMSYFKDSIDLQAIICEQIFLDLPVHPTCDHPLALPNQLCSFKNPFESPPLAEKPTLDPRFALLTQII